ncbi:MarR family winged helix-turn-helix transcriptional regulator [Actinomyces naeslundii]|uniref:MarR family transcriptional regulator n=1 Tax=Actinomyces naeslundii TaxID=1655 RepID=A0AA47FFN4_ACTNA|nr:MarR family transcriptional regulator [Actinomyces naeslundii]OMG08825.1 MarR family transcriptional regulator [Actinomyces naeslundii]OMG16940.1 MarR family transcriptional regulator [Actinomyces naeslundii]PKY94896.1 MarR family transcriptional regulator [Actinomyces naeslundii]WAL42474.1 MarR family transcriptional regulator [Actinomyces naeslundii]
MSQDDPRDLLGYQLKHVQAALRARMDEALRPLGLSAPQYLCLELLSRASGASTSDLAREAFVTRQTMSTLLRSLVDRGLAQRAAQPSSGRALPVRLTPEGQSLLKEAARVTVEVERVMISPLSESQLRAVQEALSACVAALEG